MANSDKGETIFKVNGIDYTLMLDSDAMVAMEGAALRPDRVVTFSEIMQWAQMGSWTYQRILVWASLRLHHPEISLKQAGDLMLASATEEMSRAMRDLATSAEPDPKDLQTLGVTLPNPPAAQGKRERAKRRAGTGTVSTGTAAASV